MRPHTAAAFLALPAYLTSLVLAVPSPAAYFQQPQIALTPATPSRWKTFSNAVIESIWKPQIQGSGQPTRHDPRPDFKPAPRTLAQFSGDVVLRFSLTTQEEARSLADAVDILLLDVWEFSEDWVDIRLSKDVIPSLLGLLPKTLQRSHTPLLREQALVQAIADTYPDPKGSRKHATDQSPAYHARPFTPLLGPTSSDEETNIFFSDYQPLEVITPWLRLMSSLFTTHVRLISIGTSYEGRDIPALRLGVHPDPSLSQNANEKRPTLLLTAGLHAREWISVSTNLYIAYQLIISYGKQPPITNLLETFDIIIIPTLNPDGYAHTWSTDRLWRKNRQPTSLRFCAGIDLDRSFGMMWDGGASPAQNPCSESFAGNEPFQATESKVLANWAKNETDNNNADFVAFVDFHSYSQQILYPYAYSCSASPPGLENLEELGLGLAKIVRTNHGHKYDVLPACEGNTVLAAARDAGRNAIPISSSSAFEVERRPLRPRVESAGGSALDWFYAELKVKYAYQIKLRDKGSYGFLLPKEHIVPTGKEMLDAVLYMGKHLSAEMSGRVAAPDGAREYREETGDEVEADEGEGQRELDIEERREADHGRDGVKGWNEEKKQLRLLEEQMGAEGLDGSEEEVEYRMDLRRRR